MLRNIGRVGSSHLAHLVCKDISETGETGEKCETGERGEKCEKGLEVLPKILPWLGMFLRKVS
ncbi:MAG: hypothetical protein DRG39_05745 [Deltaproteobacteria bacterium]|nr:MAG: hypothetical protein DRG39_05745 [Deltaproteobacteria bacterium]